MNSIYVLRNKGMVMINTERFRGCPHKTSCIHVRYLCGLIGLACEEHQGEKVRGRG